MPIRPSGIPKPSTGAVAGAAGAAGAESVAGAVVAAVSAVDTFACGAAAAAGTIAAAARAIAQPIRFILAPIMGCWDRSGASTDPLKIGGLIGGEFAPLKGG
jgi:hypothetical protein